jgi:hypothetical protein
MLIRYNMFAVLVVSCVLSFRPATCLSIVYDDGSTHTISIVLNENVYVDNAKPGVGTQVIMTSTGGVNYPYGFYAFGDSIITIKGGNIQGRGINLADNSQLTMTGGDFSSGIYMDNNVEFYLIGGSCSSIVASGNSSGIISHFNVKNNLYVRNHGNLLFIGGSIEQNIFAGSAYQGYHSSLIQFAGYGFEVNGISVPVGSSLRAYSTSTIHDGKSCLTGRLTGTLINGGTLDNVFYIYDDSDIVIIPEPSILSIFIFGTVGLLRRK